MHKRSELKRILFLLLTFCLASALLCISGCAGGTEGQNSTVSERSAEFALLSEKDASGVQGVLIEILLGGLTVASDVTDGSGMADVKFAASDDDEIGYALTLDQDEVVVALGAAERTQEYEITHAVRIDETGKAELEDQPTTVEKKDRPEAEQKESTDGEALQRPDSGTGATPVPTSSSGKDPGSTSTATPSPTPQPTRTPDPSNGGSNSTPTPTPTTSPTASPTPSPTRSPTPTPNLGGNNNPTPTPTPPNGGGGSLQTPTPTPTPRYPDNLTQQERELAANGIILYMQQIITNANQNPALYNLSIACIDPTGLENCAKEANLFYDPTATVTVNRQFTYDCALHLYTFHPAICRQ